MYYQYIVKTPTDVQAAVYDLLLNLVPAQCIYCQQIVETMIVVYVQDGLYRVQIVLQEHYHDRGKCFGSLIIVRKP